MAVARPLAGERPYTTGVATLKKKKKKRAYKEYKKE